jgi:hypothetical protein
MDWRIDILKRLFEVQIESLRNEIKELLTENKELVKKGESLCHQNGKLLIEQHDLQAEISKLKAEKQEMIEEVTNKAMYGKALEAFKAKHEDFINTKKIGEYGE